MRVVELYEIDNDYVIKYKKLGKIKEVKMSEFLLDKSKSWFLSEENINTANRIIPKIVSDPDGAKYIFDQLKKKGRIEFGDIINAYNYFVLGD